VGVPAPALAESHSGRVLDNERKKMKGSQKPKKLQKKRAQTTLKQRRVKKREAAKENRPSSI